MKARSAGGAAGAASWLRSAKRSGAWSEAHRVFHRTLLEAAETRSCWKPSTGYGPRANWLAGGRRRAPGREHIAEHRLLEETALARGAGAAADALARHHTLTAAA
ncbi:FCD domain-containing protein [Amycolatopsis sp. lyj-112]|uniref:FCD domain-containing protein n=1 Tax=Amycolatopsis sp. lyj-112 TaxID=2789288 RepID=UPI00397DFE28